jgi:hypothetical protein
MILEAAFPYALVISLFHCRRHSILYTVEYSSIFDGGAGAQAGRPGFLPCAWIKYNLTASAESGTRDGVSHRPVAIFWIRGQEMVLTSASLVKSSVAPQLHLSRSFSLTFSTTYDILHNLNQNNVSSSPRHCRRRGYYYFHSHLNFILVCSNLHPICVGQKSRLGRCSHYFCLGKLELLFENLLIYFSSNQAQE